MWTCATCGESHDDIVRDCGSCGMPRVHADDDGDRPTAEASDPDRNVVTARPVAFPRPPPPPSPPIPAIELPSLSARDAAIDLAMVLFLTLFVPVVGGFVMALATGPSAAPDALSLSTVGKWFEAVMMCAIAGYLCLRHRLSAASVGLRADGIGGQIGWGLIGFACCYAWLIASAVSLGPLVFWFSDDISRRQEVFDLLPLDSTVQQVALFLAVVIHEELWFRGLLLPYLRKVTGRWWAAVLISSGVFGVLHIPQGIIGVVQVAGLAVVLSLLFIRTRSLLAVMLAHFLFNLLQTKLAPFLFRLMENMPDEPG